MRRRPGLKACTWLVPWCRGGGRNASNDGFS
eukprot:CAMPEP_0196739750 /NCGR_PEP_ID=MMETSP1091-20130531/25161_1 /TAXON_ID=302021 /ORGANISM="Rhodomonas sp., Strain CCMP768" /LENGTH=30 /DNA_ID= /DNA_START= /DNA_END= /DNA_ORIENTATION=